jgi:hypothetical protein
MEIEHAASAGLVQIQDLINDAKCFEAVRKMRWPEGVLCPHCEGTHVIKFGRDETQPMFNRLRKTYR